MFRPFCKYTKRNPFSPSFYVRNYELTPIVFICILDVFMFTFCPFRTLFNTDCKLSRWTKTAAEKTERLIHPRCSKFLCFHTYEPNQELYDLLEDMRKGDEEQKKQQQQEQQQQQQEEQKKE